MGGWVAGVTLAGCENWVNWVKVGGWVGGWVKHVDKWVYRVPECVSGAGEVGGCASA